MTSLIVLILATLACIQVAWCDIPAENVTIEGYPRPKNFPNAPTVAYGVLPSTHNSTGGIGDCSWYGWVNKNYAADIGATCLKQVWKQEILTILVVDFGGTNFYPNAYEYYYCRLSNKPLPICYDYAANDIICTIGCFDLSKTGLRLPPVTDPYNPPAPSGSNVKSDAGAFQQPSVLLLGWAIAGLGAVIFNQLGGPG
ncbi:hypothetical protein M758_10G051700 [Ceratodon purpureus]|nr:hypothetical protein M758_10G051700 [Ceratodon purpureus]